MGMKTRGIYSELFIQSMKDLALGQDIPHIAALLSKEIGQPVIITNAVNRVLVIHDPLRTGVNVGEFFPLKLGKADDLEADFFTEVNQFNEGRWETEKEVLDYVFYAIKVQGKLYGNCIILCTNQALQASQRNLIQQVSLTLLLALKNDLNRETELEWLQDEFIYDVLYNNYDSKMVLYEKARHLHWNLEGPSIIVVLESSADNHGTIRRLGPAMFNSYPPIYTVINGNIVVILSLTNLPRPQIKGALTHFLTDFLSNLALNGIKSVNLGIGSTAATVTDLHQRFQEAKIALELGKVFDMGNINYFEEMGFLKFIFTAPAQELQDFSHRILGRILAYDLEMETDLLDTLRTYIHQQCQITNCAKALYVHENTLRNRLKKIEQLLNFDLDRIDHLVNIYIALLILNIEHNDEIQ